MVTLLTLTGDRHKLFERCERYMDRQTTFADQWVVVDDGREPTTCAQGQHVIRLPHERNPQQSFMKNLRAGLPACDGDWIVVIEDDDWYGAEHVERMCAKLDEFDLVGEANATYYHVGERKYRPMLNRRHASFCATAFRRSVIPEMLSRIDSPFIDMRIWRTVPNRFLYPESVTCVGLKGQVGRGGIGVGHRPRGQHWVTDSDGSKLRELIGPEDAEEVLRCVPSY